MSVKALWSVVAAVLAAGITIAVVVVHVTAGPTRSAAAFCNVYFQQKHQYLATYASRSTKTTHLDQYIQQHCHGG